MQKNTEDRSGYSMAIGIVIAALAVASIMSVQRFETSAEPRLLAQSGITTPELRVAPPDWGFEPRPQLVRAEYLKDDNGPSLAFAIRLTEYTSIRDLSFMGLGVVGHVALREPLRCVEKRIRSKCTDEYRIESLSGWRPENSYQTHPDRDRQEYSNHIFGLAIDIDPGKNPCCGCRQDRGWQDNPRCLEENGAKLFEHGAPLGAYELPECWIEAFKHFGFYWLGDDPGLRDTMHFEFLAGAEVTCP